MTPHPQEIPLVFRTSTGTALPTRAFHALVDEARVAGPAHVAAVVEQVARQTTHLNVTA